VAYRQGVNRLRHGIIRNLTPHELNRGYVFISKDKALTEILDINNFDVQIGKEVIRSRKIDVSGRVHIPRKFLANIGTARQVRIGLATDIGIKIMPLNLNESDEEDRGHYDKPGR
jgi:hypothetical protein